MSNYCIGVDKKRIRKVWKRELNRKCMNKTICFRKLSKIVKSIFTKTHVKNRNFQSSSTFVQDKSRYKRRIMRNLLSRLHVRHLLLKTWWHFCTVSPLPCFPARQNNIVTVLTEKSAPKLPWGREEGDSTSIKNANEGHNLHYLTNGHSLSTQYY